MPRGASLAGAAGATNCVTGRAVSGCGVVLAWPCLPEPGMDVRCNRCSTDYEFDDALISDRGTTVQCTNCGYQFKIYPERSQAAPPERWVVHTMSGRELVYTSLRDLQRAIGDRQVGPKDLLWWQWIALPIPPTISLP